MEANIALATFYKEEKEAAWGASVWGHMANDICVYGQNLRPLGWRQPEKTE